MGGGSDTSVVGIATNGTVARSDMGVMFYVRGRRTEQLRRSGRKGSGAAYMCRGQKPRVVGSHGGIESGPDGLPKKMATDGRSLCRR